MNINEMISFVKKKSLILGGLVRVDTQPSLRLSNTSFEAV